MITLKHLDKVTILISGPGKQAVTSANPSGIIKVGWESSSALVRENEVIAKAAINTHRWTGFTSIGTANLQSVWSSLQGTADKGLLILHLKLLLLI